MTESALQFFHAKFNSRFFSNELEPVIIKVTKRENEDSLIEATYQSHWNIIVFFYDSLYYSGPDVFLKESDPIYLLTVLFHEMIHEYCYLNDINDIDENGRHSDNFKEEAERRGMAVFGYSFSEKMKADIKEMLEDYAAICEVIIPGIDKFLL